MAKKQPEGANAANAAATANPPSPGNGATPSKKKQRKSAEKADEQAKAVPPKELQRRLSNNFEDTDGEASPVERRKTPTKAQVRELEHSITIMDARLDSFVTDLDQVKDQVKRVHASNRHMQGTLDEILRHVAGSKRGRSRSRSSSRRGYKGKSRGRSDSDSDNDSPPPPRRTRGALLSPRNRDDTIYNKYARRTKGKTHEREQRNDKNNRPENAGAGPSRLRPSIPPEVKEACRKAGICYRCGDKWDEGHRCHKAQRKD